MEQLIKAFSLAVLLLLLLVLGWLATDRAALPGVQTRGPNGEDAPMAALQTFLGLLADGQFDAAYKLVAPSSKEHGDPIAYNAPLDYESFLNELQLPEFQALSGSRLEAPRDARDKFRDYVLGKVRWENDDRFRAWVTFQGWDRDEVLMVRERGSWFIADPVHVIR